MANDIVSSTSSSPHAVSNRGPALYESAALPVELCGHVIGFRGRSRARGRCDARGRAYMGPNAIGPFSIDGWSSAWWRWRGSNPLPSRCWRDALPVEPHPHEIVLPMGFEPMVSSV